MHNISSPADLKEYLLEQCSSEQVARREFFRIIHEMEPDLARDSRNAFDLKGQQDRFWANPSN